ncbi:MAG: hypothetical protein GXP45_05060 [bacterium]|nr:hypothetical protein [bacterium]
MRIFSWFPVFNLADVWLNLGIISFLLWEILGKKE